VASARLTGYSYFVFHHLTTPQFRAVYTGAEHLRQTMSSSNNLRLSRTLGGLLGVHCGDSLGATLEFKPWSDIIRQYPNGLREIVGGGTLNWPAGHATDDTDLTRAVLLAYKDYEEIKRAGSIQAAEEFNIAQAAAEYSLKWNEGDWPGRKKGTRPVDIGHATRIGLKNYKILKNPEQSGAGTGIAGNGSLMRCIPTGLFASGKRRTNESIAISEFTHNDPRCTVACAAYNEIVAALIDGKTPQEAVEIGKAVADDLNCAKVTDAIKEGEVLPLAKVASKGPRGGIAVSVSGYVLNSLKLSIAALLDPRTFEDVLVDVVRIGGDSDTNGAIAGGLLGARDGIEKIPKRWLDKLQFREEFEEIVRRILQLQQNSE
jgi:ADP-ribosylglycohydrolase